MNVILQKTYKKYSNFNFKQKCDNVINIMSLRYCGNKLFSVKVKWLLIKRKKNYFDFELVFNTKSIIPSYLIIEYSQEKNQILILIWIIYKKNINSYLIITLKPFVLLFYIYQRFFLTLVDLAKVNLHHIFPVCALTTIFFLDPKYYFDLVRYYARPCMLLSTYKHIHTVDD